MLYHQIRRLQQLRGGIVVRRRVGSMQPLSQDTVDAAVRRPSSVGHCERRQLKEQKSQEVYN